MSEIIGALAKKSNVVLPELCGIANQVRGRLAVALVNDCRFHKPKRNAPIEEPHPEFGILASVTQLLVITPQGQHQFAIDRTVGWQPCCRLASIAVPIVIRADFAIDSDGGKAGNILVDQDWTDHDGVVGLVRADMLLDQVRAADKVVVKDKDELAFRGANAGIARGCLSTIVLLDDAGGTRERELPEVLLGSVSRSIHDDNDLVLVARICLPGERLQAVREGFPPIVCRYYNRYDHRARIDSRSLKQSDDFVKERQ
jgi:hypothetical protein